MSHKPSKSNQSYDIDDLNKEFIPLSSVPTVDNATTHSTDHIYQKGSASRRKESTVSTIVKPLLNTILSSFLTIALLLLFLHADGKAVDYTILGLSIPSIISFILNINLIFIASGISNAVAENKWVHLENGAPLSLVDVYDACSRGLAGFFTTIKARYFDWVLLSAFIFNIGLLLIGPFSQGILVPYVQNYTEPVGARFFYTPADYIGDRSNLGVTNMPPKMNGLSKNAYITAASFAQVSVGAKPPILHTCPSGSFMCQFTNVSFISTKMTCHNITENDTALVNRWGNTPTKVILKEYFTYMNITHGSTEITFPKFLYAPEMFGRTYYDLLNYTAPMMPGLNITTLLADNKVYDPQYRPYVGEQLFIMATVKDSQMQSSAMNHTELDFHKCYFNSSLNISTWETSNGTLVKKGEDISTPIILDFDNVLGNNVGLTSDNLNANKSAAYMVNAYIMQQSLLTELILPKYYTMRDYLRSWTVTQNYNSNYPFNDFMADALRSFDYAFFQAPYATGDYQSTNQLQKSGLAYYQTLPHYKVNKAVGHVLAVCLLLPIFWWFALWAVSLRKLKGIARGNSQIILLTMRLTPPAEYQLGRLSTFSNSEALKEAKSLRIRIGKQGENAVVGMDNERTLDALR